MLSRFYSLLKKIQAQPNTMVQFRIVADLLQQCVERHHCYMCQENTILFWLVTQDHSETEKIHYKLNALHTLPMDFKILSPIEPGYLAF